MLILIQLQKENVELSESSECFNAIARVLHLLEKQEMEYRGHRWDIDDNSKTLGKFYAVLKLVAHYYLELQKHLKIPQNKKITYLSPRSQNEKIAVVAKLIRETDIIEEIKKIAS